MEHKRQKTILVVDDDEALAEAVKMILEDEGYEVLTAFGSKHADQLIQEQCPDLIVLDYRLPGENGLSIAQRLKQSASTQRVPIVMISASYSIQKPAMEAGADVFLPKPFSFNTLLSTISKFLQFKNVQTNGARVSENEQ